MADPGEALCTACGLCCGDLMFQVVRLTESEAAWAKRRNLPIVEDRGQAAMPLTCACLSKTGCTAYAERPQVCRNFRCVLLRALETGDVTLEQALAKVERVQTLATRMLPHGRGALDLTSLTAERLREFGELEVLLTRHFSDPEHEFIEDDPTSDGEP